VDAATTRIALPEARERADMSDRIQATGFTAAALALLLVGGTGSAADDTDAAGGHGDAAASDEPVEDRMDPD